MDRNLQTILAELQGEMRGIYGDRLDSLLLFGSQARGEAEPGSDIDLLVVLKDAVHPGVEIKKTGHIVSSLSLRYDVVLSLTFVSTARFAKERSPLFLNIRREGIAL